MTLERVQEEQKRADALEKRNGNRVEIWYNPDTDSFTILELTGTDYTVNEGNNVRVPFHLDYLGFETKAEREADLLRRTKEFVQSNN